MHERQPTVWSLFTGVGGFDLGLERAGAQVVLQCEIDDWRRRVLASRWPGVALCDDVREVRGTPGAADILCGGFPCQDLSVAGKRAGLDGDRSGLFFEFARIAGELELAQQGGWIFLENVPGLLSSNGGRDFGVVLGTLADLGFAVGYRVLDSRHHGVPQRRRRVFIVGHSRADYARAVLLDGEGCGGDLEAGCVARTDVAVASLSGLGSGGPDDNDAQGGRLVVVPEYVTALTTRYGNTQDAPEVSAPLDLVAFHVTQDPISHGEFTPALSKESSGSLGVAFVSENQRAEVLETEYARQLTTGGGKPGQGYPLVRIGTQVRRLTPTECERLQGFPDDWTEIDGPAEVKQSKNGAWRCVSGTPDSRRYAAMGDAVTVNVIERIARRIVAVTNHRREI